MSHSDETPEGLDPDEPHTSLWFTALGVCLLLFGGIFILATWEDEEPMAPNDPGQVKEAEADAPPSDPPQQGAAE